MQAPGHHTTRGSLGAESSRHTWCLDWTDRQTNRQAGRQKSTHGGCFSWKGCKAGIQCQCVTTCDRQTDGQTEINIRLVLVLECREVGGLQLHAAFTICPYEAGIQRRWQFHVGRHWLIYTYTHTCTRHPAPAPVTDIHTNTATTPHPRRDS